MHPEIAVEQGLTKDQTIHVSGQTIFSQKPDPGNEVTGGGIFKDVIAEDNYIGTWRLGSDGIFEAFGRKIIYEPTRSEPFRLLIGRPYIKLGKNLVNPGEDFSDWQAMMLRLYREREEMLIEIERQKEAGEIDNFRWFKLYHRYIGDFQEVDSPKDSGHAVQMHIRSTKEDLHMRTFICPYCSNWFEAILPPDKCPSCKKWMIPPEERKYEFPPMRFIKEATIEDYWYCESDGCYRKNNGYNNPACPDCSSYDYHGNREPLLVGAAESYLRDALIYAESENPDIVVLRKKLKISYGWFQRFNIIEKEDSNDDWIDEILDSDE